MPDNNAGWASQLPIFSRWLSQSQRCAKWSAGNQLVDFSCFRKSEKDAKVVESLFLGMDASTKQKVCDQRQGQLYANQPTLSSMCVTRHKDKSIKKCDSKTQTNHLQ